MFLDENRSTRRIVGREQGSDDRLFQMAFRIGRRDGFNDDFTVAEVDFRAAEVVIDVFDVIAFASNFYFAASPTFSMLPEKLLISASSAAVSFSN